jgi:hypothetical protein
MRAFGPNSGHGGMFTVTANGTSFVAVMGGGRMSSTLFGPPDLVVASAALIRRGKGSQEC